MKIFIVEDDQLIRDELVKLLGNYGYACHATTNFQNVVEEVFMAKVDLLLLDINLPTVDGYYICREIRKKSNLPIIIVTSRNTQMDELMSMNLGADDFITKPYNTQILLARISAVLKRSTSMMANDIIVYQGLEMNVAKGTVTYQGLMAELTKNEQQLFQLLLKYQGRIVKRSELMDDLWQTDNYIDDNTLTVNMNRLRKKLEAIGIENMIQTKRGQGYMI